MDCDRSCLSDSFYRAILPAFTFPYVSRSVVGLNGESTWDWDMAEAKIFHVHNQPDIDAGEPGCTVFCIHACPRPESTDLQGS